MVKSKLSDIGIAFLADKEVYKALTKIAAQVGVTPEEYLLRFEEVLNTDPELIMSIFEGK